MRYLHLLLLVLVAAFCSCDGPKSFKIKGEIADGANINLYIKYYGNDAVRTGVTVARDGKFEVEAASELPTIVEILDNEYRTLGRLYLKNGDDVKVVIDRNNINKNVVTGSEINEQWSALLNANAELLASSDSRRINEFVDGYVAENPDNLLSGLMFATYYDYSVDPVHADSIASLMSPDARPVTILGAYATQMRGFAERESYAKMEPFGYRGTDSDSSLVYKPDSLKASLLSMSNETSRRVDSVVPLLRDISKTYPKSKLQILDLVLYADTTSWKYSCRHDSASWQQGWIPGGTIGKGLDRLAIPRLPYYIVTDSAGRQVYRGQSLPAAEAVIKDLIK